jgi:solute carrier family 25 thiamine pyrophosphate transporter 19
LLDAGCGGVAGVFSKICTMPFDTVRKRLQIHGPDPSIYVVGAGAAGTTSSVQVARNILVKEGILGFFKGSLPAILKAAPSSAVTFGAFEYTKMVLLKWRAARDGRVP